MAHTWAHSVASRGPIWANFRLQWQDAFTSRYVASISTDVGVVGPKMSRLERIVVRKSLYMLPLDISPFYKPFISQALIHLLLLVEVLQIAFIK